MATSDARFQKELDHQADREKTRPFDASSRGTAFVSHTDMTIMRLLHSINSEPAKLEILKIVKAMLEAQCLKDRSN